MLYGTFSGLQESIYFPSVGLPEKLRAAFSMSWALFVKHIFVTFSWVSGWSFLHLPKAGYLIFAVFLSVAGAGIIRGLISRSSESPTFSGNGYALTVSIALLIFFALGIAYHEMNVMATVKVMGGPGGWYLYALVVPISFVVSFGIASFGRKTARLLFAIFSAALFLTEAYGFIAVLFPYYEGIAVPAANGWGVEKIQEVEIPAGEAIARLLANKPAVFSPALLVVAAAVYVLLYCASMAVWFFLGRTDTPSAETNPHEDAPAAVSPAAKD
jgi:hypothetical protein